MRIALGRGVYSSIAVVCTTLPSRTSEFRDSVASRKRKSNDWERPVDSDPCDGRARYFVTHCRRTSSIGRG
ncbi:unnamed protein product, partial [Iphiclides podalirius]